MRKIEDKREHEKSTVYFMIELYCKKHHNTNGVCKHCKALYMYVEKRIDGCPFMETKTFCSNCKVHCLQNEYREEIRKIMRYSGPRMLLYNPMMAIRHVYASRKEKKNS